VTTNDVEGAFEDADGSLVARDTQLCIESAPCALAEIERLDTVQILKALALLFQEDVDLALYLDSAGRDGDFVGRVFWVNINAREVLGAGYLHELAANELLRLDAEDVTVAVDLIGQLLDALQLKGVLHKGIHSAHHQNQAPVLHTREVLEAVRYFEADLLCRNHYLGPLGLDIERFQVKLALPFALLLFELFLFAIA